MTRRGTPAAAVLAGGISRHTHMPYLVTDDTVVIDVAPPAPDLLSARSVLGHAASTRACCERDHDGDGNCDRHPPGWTTRTGKFAAPQSAVALTADTITDERIRELMVAPSATQERFALCQTAIDAIGPDRDKARARCAEILNERAQAKAGGR